MDSPPIPGELLVDIFLRLPNPADLVRASASCVSFRRLAADRSFLRQYRKLHAPPLLGFIEVNGEFHRASPPYPSASAASVVALATDFSFSFLPAPACDWLVLDIRDGRVLLYRSYIETPGGAFRLKEIVVCDPLHRQYLLLPPIPDEVFTSLEKWVTFLVPQPDNADKEEGTAEETAFRVICMARRGDQLVAIVFSSTSGQWQAGPSHSWIDSFYFLTCSQCAYGCFYWVTECRQELLVLDTRRMEFSIADAPLEAKCHGDADIAIVEAGEGKLGMFVLPGGKRELSYYIIRRNNAGSSGQWLLEKTISLDYGYNFAGSMGGHLFLEHTGDCFSLDVKTFQLQKVSVSASKHRLLWPRAYTNFPPSLLSSMTVASGIREVAEKPMLEQDVEVLPAEAHSQHHYQNTTDTSARGQAGVSRIGGGADYGCGATQTVDHSLVSNSTTSHP
uniref:Uncharacterized protein n=1 Tax=Avena sativa TaxID=4498 RepID=A0ACD5ZBZ2_AVESA